MEVSADLGRLDSLSRGVRSMIVCGRSPSHAPRPSAPRLSLSPPSDSATGMILGRSTALQPLGSNHRRSMTFADQQGGPREVDLRGPTHP